MRHAGSTSTTTNVRAFRADEWKTYKSLRLRSLREDPDAFASTLQDAQKNSEARWRDRLREVVESPYDLALVAEADDLAVGLVWVRFDDAERQLADFYQMWVAPEARGRGLGEALVRRALAWSREVGAKQAVLDVTDQESAAVRLYKRCGFVVAGPAVLPSPDREIMALPMRVRFAEGDEWPASEPD